MVLIAMEKRQLTCLRLQLLSLVAFDHLNLSGLEQKCTILRASLSIRSLNFELKSKSLLIDPRLYLSVFIVEDVAL